MWWLFPCGAFNRLLTRNKKPPPKWAEALTRICGTTEWEERFYKANAQPGLFGSIHSDRDRPLAAARCERCGDRRSIRGKVGEGIMAAGNPFAVAVAALIERDHAEAVIGEARCELVPRVARLVEAMEQDHGRAIGRTAIEVVKAPPGELDETHRRIFPDFGAAINS
jgi:hypothetical protein